MAPEDGGSFSSASDDAERMFWLVEWKLWSFFAINPDSMDVGDVGKGWNDQNCEQCRRIIGSKASPGENLPNNKSKTPVTLCVNSFSAATHSSPSRQQKAKKHFPGILPATQSTHRWIVDQLWDLTRDQWFNESTSGEIRSEIQLWNRSKLLLSGKKTSIKRRRQTENFIEIVEIWRKKCVATMSVVFY
jgi:hypothetical protein